MKIIKPYTIDFFDVDHQSIMTFKAIARAFQGMATTHSAKVGAGYKVLNRNGFVWFLHRLRIDVISFPRLFDEVVLQTWSRGFKGFKGFREYRIASSEGTPLVQGSSVWLFYNFVKKKVIKVPQEISDHYTFETQKNFDTELDIWNPQRIPDPANQVSIGLRYSDFDINGHVNNTEYIGFLESAFYSDRGKECRRIEQLKIRFDREIDRAIDNVRVGWDTQGNSYFYNIYDENTLFAHAQIQASDHPVPVGT